MFCQNTFTTKTLQTTLAKVFFVFIFCFVKHKSVKVFDVHVMRFIIINYKQQIHRVFKFLIWNVNWKNQPILVTKHVNGNVVLFFNLAEIFFLHREFNSIITSFLSSRVIISGCILTGLIWLIWHHKKHFWSLFLMLISSFFGLFNSTGNFM